MIFLLAFAVALFASAAACAVAVVLAPRLGFTDNPGAEAHKQHKQRVPYGGGAAMLAGLVAGGAVLAGQGLATSSDIFAHRADLLPILLGALALFGLGLVDDIWPLGAKAKLASQALAIGGAVIWADLQVQSLGDWPWLATALPFIWCLVIANAYNLMDHADGLSGSMAFVSLVVLISTAIQNGDWPQAGLWLTLLGAIGGFLAWNLPPARIYMGDAGSLPLGFLIAAGTLMATFWPSTEADAGSHLTVLAPVLIVALPAYDTIVVVIKRLHLGRPLMHGDRNHLSHRLRRLGLSSRSSLAAAVALQTALAGCALQMRHQDLLTVVVLLAQAGAIVLAAVLLEAARDRGA